MICNNGAKCCRTLSDGKYQFKTIMGDFIELNVNDNVCEYLDKTGKSKLTPSFHRVAQCTGERYSVVFKQRTCVCKTPPRYQEDYHLAVKQMKIIDSLEFQKKKLLIVLAAVIVFSICYSFFLK